MNQSNYIVVHQKTGHVLHKDDTFVDTSAWIFDQFEKWVINGEDLDALEDMDWDVYRLEKARTLRHIGNGEVLSDIGVYQYDDSFPTMEEYELAAVRVQKRNSLPTPTFMHKSKLFETI